MYGVLNRFLGLRAEATFAIRMAKKVMAVGLVRFGLAKRWCVVEQNEAQDLFCRGSCTCNGRISTFASWICVESCTLCGDLLPAHRPVYRSCCAQHGGPCVRSAFDQACDAERCAPACPAQLGWHSVVEPYNRPHRSLSRPCRP